MLKGVPEITFHKSYQVGCQTQNMWDTKVLCCLIAASCFHKQTHIAQRWVVLQRCYHQSICEFGHLAHQKKQLLENYCHSINVTFGGSFFFYITLFFIHSLGHLEELERLLWRISGLRHSWLPHSTVSVVRHFSNFPKHILPHSFCGRTLNAVVF